MEFNPLNKQAHLDIAHEIIKQQNGLFTFTLRINGKQIVDLVFREIYGKLESKPSVSRNT